MKFESKYLRSIITIFLISVSGNTISQNIPDYLYMHYNANLRDIEKNCFQNSSEELLKFGSIKWNQTTQFVLSSDNENLDQLSHKLVFRNFFSLTDQLEQGKIILQIPACQIPYGLYINNKKVKPNFSYRLINRIDISSLISDGNNTIHISVDELPTEIKLSSFLTQIRLIRLPLLYISNYKVSGDLFTKSGAYGVPLNTQSGLRDHFTLHNFSKSSAEFYCKRELHLNNYLDERNYLSYLVNPITYDSLSNPFSIDAPKSISSKDNVSIGKYMYTPSVKAWNTEEPTTYILSTSLFDNNEVLLQNIQNTIGYKNIEIHENQILINDHKLKLKAINYNPGIFSNEKQIISDILNIKTQNFNAVYVIANEINPVLLKVCDILGVFVIINLALDELTKPMQNAEIKDILFTLFFSYINHPSLLSWAFYENGSNGELLEELLKYRNEYRAFTQIPLLVISENMDLLKRVNSTQMIYAGIQNRDDVDVQTLSENLNGLPFIIFYDTRINSNYFSSLNFLHNNRPSNFHGFVLTNLQLDNNDLQSTEYSLKNSLSNIEWEWLNKSKFSFYIKNNFDFINLSDFTFEVELSLSDSIIFNESFSPKIEPTKSIIYNMPYNNVMTDAEHYDLTLKCYKNDNPLMSSDTNVVFNKRISIFESSNVRLKTVE